MRSYLALFSAMVLTLALSGCKEGDGDAEKEPAKKNPAKQEPGKKTPAPPAYKDRPAVLVPKISKGPMIDGKLDDSVWKKAPVLRFKYTDGRADPPKHDTEARVLASKDAFFVAFRCADSELKNLKAEKRDRDTEIWEDDSVEIFLASSESAEEPYHQVIVNAVGSIYDGYMKGEGWECKNLKVVTGREEKAWTVEVEIPFASLNLPEHAEEMAKGWRLNLNRTRPKRDDQDGQDTAWSPTEGTSNHVPEKFGYAFFEVFKGKLPVPPKPGAEAKKTAEK
ncbi:MAG: hypothetical protein HY291_14020 [Planctomycetes bacterium]|nr:hypothetical protein [Planctomycetota bacterium]